MEKDPRYELIRVMYDDGHIERLSDIFKYIPKTTVAHDAGLNIDQMNARLKSPDKWLVKQLFRIGELCELTEAEMMALVVAEWKKSKLNKK